MNFKGRVTSGSSIEAAHLECDTADIKVSSDAGISIYAEERLRAKVSSGGVATVLGKPSIEDVNTSSSGQVRFVTLNDI